MRRSAGVLVPLVVAVLVAVGIGLARDERPAAETPPAPTTTAPSPGRLASASPSAAVPDPRTATDHVTIDGRSYRIEAFLWRDFMPITPPGGKPLAASIKVIAEDGRAFPQAISADRVWVHGPELWDTTPEVRRSPEAGTPPSQIEVVAFNGPKWGPGTKVDVAVRLRSGGATYLIGQRGVTIEQTS